MKGMLKKLIVSIGVFLTVLITGCAAPMKVAQVELTDSPHPILTEIKDETAHLYFVNSNFMGRYIPTSVRAGSKASVEVPYKTYTKFIVNPGKQWVIFENIWGKSDYMCQNFEENKNYFFSLETAFSHKFNESDKKALKNKKQTKKIYAVPIESISSSDIEIDSVLIKADNQDTIKLKEFLDIKYNNNSIEKNNTLLVNIKTIDYIKGNQFGRYIFGAVDKFKTYQTIEAEFHLKGKKVDSLVLSKEVAGGLFGGSSEKIIPFFADDIESYINCVYRDIR